MQIAVAHVAVDVGVVVVAAFFGDTPPQARYHGKFAPFHAGHGIDAVPRAGEGVALAVGLVCGTDAEHPQATAAGQVGFHRLGEEDFGLVVGVAEGRGHGAFIYLPV